MFGGTILVLAPGRGCCVFCVLGLILFFSGFCSCCFVFVLVLDLDIVLLVFAFFLACFILILFCVSCLFLF